MEDNKHFPNRFRVTFIGITLKDKEVELVKEFSCGPTVKTIEDFKSHDIEPFFLGFCFVHSLKSVIVNRVERI